MDKDESCCQSCGKPYVEHLGLIGTCFRLQDCRALLQEILSRLDPKTRHEDLMLAKLIENVLDRTKP